MTDSILRQTYQNALKHIDAEIAKFAKHRTRLLELIDATGETTPAKNVKAPVTRKPRQPRTTSPATVMPSNPPDVGTQGPVKQHRQRVGAISAVLPFVEARGEVHADQMLHELNTRLGYTVLTRKSLDATLSNESKRDNPRLARVQGKPSVWTISEQGRQEIDRDVEEATGNSETAHPAHSEQHQTEHEPQPVSAGPVEY